MERRRIRPGGQRADFRSDVSAGLVSLESAHSPAALASHRPARGESYMRAFGALAIVSLLAASAAAAEKLTFEDRVELTRGLTAEYGKAKVLLPRSKKALEFDSNGTYDKKQWSDIAKE